VPSPPRLDDGVLTHAFISVYRTPPLRELRRAPRPPRRTAHTPHLLLAPALPSPLPNPQLWLLFRQRHTATQLQHAPTKPAGGGDVVATNPRASARWAYCKRTHIPVCAGTMFWQQPQRLSPRSAQRRMRTRLRHKPLLRIQPLIATLRSSVPTQRLHTRGIHLAVFFVRRAAGAPSLPLLEADEQQITARSSPAHFPISIWRSSISSGHHAARTPAGRRTPIGAYIAIRLDTDVTLRTITAAPDNRQQPSLDVALPHTFASRAASPRTFARRATPHASLSPYRQRNRLPRFSRRQHTCSCYHSAVSGGYLFLPLRCTGSVP